MTNRFTDKMLEARVAYLNELTGNPMEYSTPTNNGRNINIGHYHISHAYGGVCLHQTVNSGGGVTCPLSNGHGPKRDLYNELNALIRGIEIGKESI